MHRSYEMIRVWFDHIMVLLSILGNTYMDAQKYTSKNEQQQKKPKTQAINPIQ